jgi:endo-1,4-beta-D-glucanase Y
LVDGRETFDRTGIWQNKSSAGRRLAHSVLFAWRWPTRGTHTLTFQPVIANAKEGESFLHLVGYELLR